MKQIRKRLTYANVMSSLAVFLVIGGASAFAAGQLGKNTVGAKQLKRNAVTTAKIKNGAVTGAKIKSGSVTGSNLSLGTIGTVPSATHATAADKATQADNAVQADKAALAVNSTNLPDVLGSGQTLRGTVSDATDATSGGVISSQNVSFPIPLASKPTAHIIDVGGTPPAECPGTAENPSAVSGHLCIYIGVKSGPVGSYSAINPEKVSDSQPAGGRFGYFIYNNSTGAGRDQWWGTWAVTG